MPLSPVDQGKYKVADDGYVVDPLIERADSEIRIGELMASYGQPIPSGEYYSAKIFCPFHYEHADPHDKNCRVFPETNNIYCWAMHGYITPSVLYSMRTGMSRKNAAKALLEERGLLRRLSYKELWEEVTAPPIDDNIDGAYLTNALQIRLKKSSEYLAHQYNPKVRQAWARCSTLLEDLLEADDVNREKFVRWLDLSEKYIMACVTLLSEEGKANG